ncbi:hypothetical protein MYF49_002787, partial [Enterococcus faecium]|nr:hypothetical protein [Enterococcus faecium]
MKKYLVIGCSLLFFGGTAYAAMTQPVLNLVQSVFEATVQTDSMDSLSTENLTLKEITTHKISNDYSKLLTSSYVDDQVVKKHQDDIDVLTELLTQTDFSTIMETFGNEQLGTIPENDKHTGEEYDRVGLSETYARLQQEGREFFEAFFTAFPGTDQTQIEEHFNELIFVATYLGKWYDVPVGESSLWELMYFDGAELTTDSRWGIEQLLAFAEELQADNYEALLSKNVGNTFKKTEVYSQFTGKAYSELIEWFIEKQTGSTDYSSWFYNYFNGTIKIDTALTEEDDVGIWNRNQELKDNLPYLLTQKPDSTLNLIESYRLLMMTSRNDKEEDILNAVRTIKNQEAFFYRTYDHKKEVDDSIGQVILWGPNEDLLNEEEDYGNNLLLPSENFKSHNGSGAVGKYQYIALQRSGYDPNSIAHELGHAMNRLLNAGSEFLTTFIYNGVRNKAAYINMYADGQTVQYPSYFPLNSDVNQIQNKNDLVTMTKNSENFIYAMDAVIADVVLDMPISEQAKYIRKIPIDVESGIMNDHTNPEASFDAVSLTVSELEEMNLKSIDDLINYGLVIMEPDDTNNNILANGGEGYGTPLTYASYFLVNGKTLDHTHRIINTLVAENGWEGFKNFNDVYASEKKDIDKKSIAALRSALNDPSVTYRTYTTDKYYENWENLGENGLKTMSYLDLKKTFEHYINNFYEVKQTLYKNYLSVTDSFKNDAFGYDSSTIKEVRSYEELYDVITENSKATISITSDFTIPENAKEIESFEGILNGNGHTISKGSKALFTNLKNATVESLVLDDFVIHEKATHTGVLANQVEETKIGDVHVVNSIINIKNGVQASVGGFIGEARNSIISQCSSQGNEITGSYAGGIVGYGENTSITDTYVYEGTVTGNEVGDLRVGGFAGNFISGTIKNTYSSATIKNGHGFIGSTYSYGTPAINEANSFSIGNVDEDRLKFMEDDNNSKTYQNNYELSTASGKSSAGIAKLDVKAIEESALKENNFYTEQLGWNTENTWQIEKVANGELPYLKNSDPRNPVGYQEPVVFEWVTPVNDQSTILKGKVSQKATVTVYDEGTKIGQEESTENGEFSIPIEPLMGNHQLKIVAKTNTIEKEMYLQVQGTAPTIKGKKELTIPIGEYEFKPEQLLESVSDRYGEENLTYTVDTSKINFGLPGKYDVIVTATNSIGRSSSIKISVTLQDYNSIVFQGYGPQERFRMGLQTSNRKIRLVENKEFTTQLDSGSGTYIDIHLYDQTGKLKKQASTNAEDLSEVLVKAFDQTPYEEGDLLDISYLQHSNKMQFYQKGEVELPFGNSGKNQLFTIKNDELVRLTDDMIQTKEVTAEVGNFVRVEDFVDSVHESLSKLPIRYSLNSEFNPGKTGEQTNTMIVSFGEAFTQEVPIKLTYIYDNNISIRCYQEEERFILGLNEDKRTINFVTDTSKDTQLDSGSGEYLNITITDKLGKQKYQMKANAEDSPSKIIDSLNKKSYENGDMIHIKHIFDNKLQYYQNGEIKLGYDSCKKEELFII